MAGLATRKPVTVEVLDRVFTLSPLNLREDLTLDAFHRKNIKRGQVYADMKDVLAKAAPEHRATILAEITKIEAGGSPLALQESQMSPEGVAFELWLRAKKADPTLSLKELTAVITEANNYEVYEAMWDALKEQMDSKSAESE